jgi:hypothetical protein
MRVVGAWRGQALVETALVFPLLIALSLGVVQVAIYVHAKDVLTSAAQEGARLAAEDGRSLDECYVRIDALVRAGLGSSLEPFQAHGRMDSELVQINIDTHLRPILPLPAADGLPLHVQASVTRERFRPGGGGG